MDPPVVFSKRTFRSGRRWKIWLHSRCGFVITIVYILLVLQLHSTLSMPQTSSGTKNASIPTPMKSMLPTSTSAANKPSSKSSAASPEAVPKLVIDPTLDGRKEIANYNRFMDQIFIRMNLAIKAKRLDPMDLKIMPMLMANAPKVKVPRFERSIDGTTEETSNEPLYEREGRKGFHDITKVKAWLHGMSTLKRTSDVSIFFYETHRSVQCPFSLGPLELKVTKTTIEKEDILSAAENSESDDDKTWPVTKTKSAKAVTDLMLGLMDLKIDTKTGKVEITDVIFDEPGGVSVQGSLKRRANLKKNILPYKLVLASKAAASLKNVAKLVVGLGDGNGNNRSIPDKMMGQVSSDEEDEWTNSIT